MPNTIKLTLYENDKIFDTIENETSTDTPDLIKSIEEFRLKVNETLTKIIEDDGEFDDYIEDDNISSEEDQSTGCVTPKKKKKLLHLYAQLARFEAINKRTELNFIYD